MCSSYCDINTQAVKHHRYCDSPFASSSVVNNFSGPNDIGSSCSSVMTVDLPCLSYINIGMLSYSVSQLLQATRCMADRKINILRKTL